MRPSDISIDLGAVNTLVYVRGRGIVLDEPSMVALHRVTGEVLAVGRRAKGMLGRVPGHIRLVQPLKDGVISEFDATEKMVRAFVEQVRRRYIPFGRRPRTVVTMPYGVTGVEQRALLEAMVSAGTRPPAMVLEEPLAAAIGAGLPVTEPAGSMIVDIGGGVTEVAVISLGGIVVSTSVRIGGDELDEAVIAYLKREHGICVGELTAERVKIAIGSVIPHGDEPRADVRGRDLATGLPRSVVVHAADVRAAIDEPVSAIVNAVIDTLDRTPPELATDILESGIALSGGGALLDGIDARLHVATGMPVFRVDRPLHAVAIGAGRCLEDHTFLDGALAASTRH
ncbi:MAG TPA: rod shape-determining protein [Egibacteraceae bacterium]|nr:rod shape-determining protein [Egibacteraceae bacterium]